MRYASLAVCLIFFLIALFSATSLADDGDLYAYSWLSAVGGDGDVFLGAAFAPDGGAYLVGAAKDELDGKDAWAVRIGSDGDMLWSRRYGGSTDGMFTHVTPLTHGGAVFLGEAWAIRVDEDGEVVWNQTLGGNMGDRLNALFVDEDVILLAGESLGDAWACAISVDTGLPIWEFTAGSAGSDRFTHILANGDGWMLLGEWTRADGGGGRIQPFRLLLDKDGNERGRTVFPLKYDAWIYDIAPYEGGWVVTGKTNADNSDGWIGMISSTGVLNVAYIEGNTDSSFSRVLAYQDGTIIAAGQLNTEDSQLAGVHGGIDVWVVSTTRRGVQWEQALGGSLDDTTLALLRRPDGRYIVVAQTSSMDGDLTAREQPRAGLIAMLDKNGNLLGAQPIAPYPDQVWSMCLTGARRELLLIGEAALEDGSKRAVAARLAPK